MAFLDITQSSSIKLLIRNIFKRQIRSSFLCALHPANRGFYEITVLGPSFIGCVDQVNTFCKSFCLIFFQLFWWSYIILTSKKWQPNFSKVFRKFCHFIFLKTVWEENYCDTWLLIPNSISGKIAVLELLSKMLCSDQILENSWDSSISWISRVMKMIFFASESQINWSWSDMARHGQIDSKLYIRNTFKRRIWSKFLCILNPYKQRVLGNHFHFLVLTALVSQLNIFHRSHWSVFLLMFLIK